MHGLDPCLETRVSWRHQQLEVLASVPKGELCPPLFAVCIVSTRSVVFISMGCLVPRTSVLKFWVVKIFLIPHSNPGVRDRELECAPSMGHLILTHPMEGQQKWCGGAPWVRRTQRRRGIVVGSPHLRRFLRSSEKPSCKQDAYGPIPRKGRRNEAET